MPFAKGHPPLGSGRPVGSMNLATAGRKTLMNYLKEEGADRFLRILSGVGDKEFFGKYLELIEFAFPKQSRVQNELSGSVEVRNVPPITDERLAEIARQINNP